MKVKNKKRKPEPFQPDGFTLLCAASYAEKTNVSVPRVYQLFQEGKIDMISIDKKQFVRISNSK